MNHSVIRTSQILIPLLFVLFYMWQLTQNEQASRWISYQINQFAGQELDDDNDASHTVESSIITETGHIIDIKASPIDFRKDRHNRLYDSSHSRYERRRQIVQRRVLGLGKLEVSMDLDVESRAELDVIWEGISDKMVKSFAGKKDIQITGGSDLPRMYHKDTLDFDAVFRIDATTVPFARSLLTTGIQRTLMDIQSLEPSIKIDDSRLTVKYNRCPNTPYGVNQALSHAVQIISAINNRMLTFESQGRL